MLHKYIVSILRTVSVIQSKQLLIVVLTEEIVHLFGTIFSGGLIHIWSSGEYLGQQDGVCGIESKLTRVPNECETFCILE